MSLNFRKFQDVITPQNLNRLNNFFSEVVKYINSLLKSLAEHTHDDRYYTETQTDTIVSSINSDISDIEDDISDLETDISAIRGLNVYKTTSFQLVLSHAQGFIRCNHATTTIQITVPTNATVGFPNPTDITFWREGAAEVRFVAASGVTFKPATTLFIDSQYDAVTARYLGSDTWALIGQLKA